MAAQISNVVTPAQQALNNKMFGGISASTPATTTTGLSNPSFLGNLGFGNELSSSKAPVAPSTPSISNPLTSFQPAKTTTPAVAPAAHTIAPAPVGQTTAATGQQANPNYQPGSIGPGNTPYLSPASTTPANGIPAASAVSTPATPPVPTTFPGLVGSLTGAGQSAVSTGASQEKEAFQKAQALQAQLAGSQSNEANTLANMQGNPIPIEFQQGRGNIVQNLYEQQQNALASELQGQSNLAGQGTAIQGQGINALGTATGAAQPQLAGIGSQQYYNPLDTSSAGASNQYGTGPAAAANVSSIQDHTKNINDWSAARQSATNIGGQLTSFLQQNQINPSDFNGVNKFLQAIGAQTSSPQYKQFYNLVTDLANTYAPVLGQGDASNYKVQLAQSLLDGTANGQSIPQILQGLDNQAQAKIQGEQETVQRLQTGQNPNPAAATNMAGQGATSAGGTIQTPYGTINPNL